VATEPVALVYSCRFGMIVAGVVAGVVVVVVVVEVVPAALQPLGLL
jgi:hypothetical protein